MASSSPNAMLSSSAAAPSSSSSGKPYSSTAHAKPEFPSLREQAELVEVWAQGLVVLEVPHDSGEGLETIALQAEPYCHANKLHVDAVPQALKATTWYAITAWNPMGQDWPEEKNKARNVEMEAYLKQELVSDRVSLFGSYGTNEAASWREDGFAIGVVKEDATEEVEARVLEAGRKFGQAAVYKHEFDEARGRLLQTIVPCFEELAGLTHSAPERRIVLGPTPTVMKAAAMVEYGGADAVEVIEVPRPVAPERRSDIVVRNAAFATNPVDLRVLSNFGQPEAAEATNAFCEIPEGGRVVGWDGAGVVTAVGEDVTRFAVGDHVYYAGVINRQGSFAEYTCVDEALAAKKPTTLDWAEAASVPLTGLTAYEGLVQRLGIPVPETPEQKAENGKKCIVVLAAAGGVGSFVVQLAKRVLGLRVVGTASRPETVEWVMQLGADHTVNHREPLRPQLEALGIEGVEYVFAAYDYDAVWGEIIDVLKPFGSILAITRGGEVNPSDLITKSLTLSFEFMFTRGLYGEGPELQGDVLETLARLVDEGVVRHTLGQRFEFTTEGVRAALGRQAAGNSVGKNVVVVRGGL